MLITCLRHATAESHDQCDSDAERALTQKGRDQVSRVAAFCRRNRLKPGVLYASPLLRAQQTASLLQTQLVDCPPVNTVDWLSLGTPLESLLAELERLAANANDDIWLVGHEPDLSRLFCHLLQWPDRTLIVKKASLTRVEFSMPLSGFAQLHWTVPCALMH